MNSKIAAVFPQRPNGNGHREWGNMTQAASRGKVHRNTIRNWIDNGIIPPEAVEEYGKKKTQIDLAVVDEIRKSGRKE